MKKPNYYYAVCQKGTTRMILESGQLPIFWRFKIAKEIAENFKAHVVKLDQDEFQKFINQQF